MNFKKISLLIVLLLIADQALKIWIKTHMHLDESIVDASTGASCCWASSGS